MSKDGLYSDILKALASAKQLGRLEERYYANGKDNLISERKARELFGAKALREYRAQYGCPERTGWKPNSKRLYSLSMLNEIVEAARIEEAIVTFETKVRESQRCATMDTVQAWLDGGGRDKVAKGLPVPNNFN